MEREDIDATLDEYRDEANRRKLVQLLTDRLIREMDDMPAETDTDRHRLNLVIRELEEEIDWIESEKLSGFDPEQE